MTDLIISESKKSQFAALFHEFLQTYPSTPDGRKHIESYPRVREQAVKSFRSLVEAADRGEDVTEGVLLKLLPYNDSASNREKGAWVHIAPAITGDIKKWFERSRWTNPDDWPNVAVAILGFVRRCIDDPARQSEACEEFSALPYSRGFQTGMLTPILNALRPRDFALINNKSRIIINYFASTAFKQNLTDYPATNAAAFNLVKELSGILHQPDDPEILDSDLLDMFCHWLVAVKKYDFKNDPQKTNCWKIAPGDNAWQWEECRDSGFIAIGWDDLGDVSSISLKEFKERQDELVASRENWTKSGSDQVWKFARQIQVGDRVIANRGTTEVLGIGTVVGSYYFVPHVRHRHRLPVRWDDLKLRAVNEHGWRRTLVEIDREKFERILLLQPPARVLAEPFSNIFADWDEAEWAFEFLRDTAERLGASGPDDPRFVLTLPIEHKSSLLRLNFGGWVVLDFRAKQGIDIALITNEVDLGERFPHWQPFKQPAGDPEICVYKLPMDMVRSMEKDLRRAYERSFHYIAQKFRYWKGSTWRSAHRAELFEAIFDPEKRHKLFLEGLRRGHEGENEIEPEYTLEQFALDAGFDEKILSRWARAIERKGQAILYGPPGTGKTFVAERLARHLIGGGDGFSALVQFHPAYAYEDFIQGIRPQPSSDGGLSYPLMPGRFLEFCSEAKRRRGRCVLIVDEINRANLARVFGELMYLMEYRDREISLAGGQRFAIPDNVRIIGTMNTADRSIALVDHALRRRFAFLALYPSYDILRRYHEKTAFPVDGLIDTLKRLNAAINDPHYEVGITFFLRPDMPEQIEEIWRMEIEPYLEEYFFDQPEKVDQFRWQCIHNIVLS